MGFVVCETTPTCMLGVYPTCKTLVSNPCSNLKWGIKYRKTGIVLQTLCRTTQALQSPASLDILGCLRHFTNKLIPTFSYKVHQFKNAPFGAFFVWFFMSFLFLCWVANLRGADVFYFYWGVQTQPISAPRAKNTKNCDAKCEAMWYNLWEIKDRI